MTTTTRPTENLPAIDWAAIVTRPAPEREDALAQSYCALAELPEAERLAHLRAIVETTYRLPDDDFRTLTESRLRAWLSLDQGVAATVARSYDAVLQEVSADDAMRRVAVVQTLMRDFSDDEQRRLHRLNPEERARGLTLTRLDNFADPEDGAS
jgi:CHASE3 domain sensor protein